MKNKVVVRWGPRDAVAGGTAVVKDAQGEATKE
jgi:hypothetical protein